jgi:hypothetical protein
MYNFYVLCYTTIHVLNNDQTVIFRHFSTKLYSRSVNNVLNKETIHKAEVEILYL